MRTKKLISLFGLCLCLNQQAFGVELKRKLQVDLSKYKTLLDIKKIHPNHLNKDKPQQLDLNSFLKKNIQDNSDDGGFESSGGGTIVKTGVGAPILLDFAIYDQEFVDEFHYSKGSSVKLKNYASILGYERFSFDRFEEMEVYPLLKERIEIWQESSPVITHAIKAALKGADWRFTPHRVRSFYEGELFEGAVFYSGGKGAWISAPVWNRVGDFTKVGLLIHEALRHMSISYGDKLSEDTIHDLTYRIVLTNPVAGESLDSRSYYHRDSITALHFRSQDELSQSKAKLRSLALDERLKNRPELLSIVQESIDSITDPEALGERIDKLDRLYEITFDSNEAKLLLELSNAIHEVVVSHFREKASTPALEFIDTIRSLDSIMSLGSIGESMIIDYLESGENPFGIHELKERQQFQREIKKLKVYHQGLLERGALIEAY
ncbi:hypothetical protein M902_0746 [Bacteriovorax sp. BAL6_X]|uniref:hypothetical protein n=1 Tax=Bacteriovorax sp. BAL6_X TaxID=1201290 RepID=UPI000385B411|nr:hypothetical protein [Bacteriovorax sp. BAL6_X]EPZ49582.1 hypothetical protein M902_0746 [Bacteriovorax sp. BAL6_X]